MEKITDMKVNLLYVVAIVLLAIWFVGFMFFDANGFYHLVFLAAVVTVVYKLIQDYKSNNQ